MCSGDMVTSCYPHTLYPHFPFHIPGATFRHPLCVTHAPGCKKWVCQSRSLRLTGDWELRELCPPLGVHGATRWARPCRGQAKGMGLPIFHAELIVSAE